MSHKSTRSEHQNVAYRQISKWKDMPFKSRTSRNSETLHKTDSMVSLCFQSLTAFVNNDNLQGLQSFLETKQVQIDDRDENGTTALMVAATKGKGAFVRELLAHGADPNAEDNDGWTALLCASKEGHYDIVLQLLEHNADIDHRDMGGWSGLMWATYKGHTNVAVHLLDRGAEVNAHGNYHVSSLLWAAGRGHLEILKALINHGAKVNVGDKYGTTALVWASRKGYTEIVEVLLKAGANVDTAGMYSWTPLIVATYGNHVDVVNLLLEHKPNVNALDKDGCSPLTIACKEGYYEIATALLAAGAYINIQDRAGDTNLIHAVKGGHKNVVEALLKKYADVDTLGKDRKTAIYVAVEKGNLSIVKLLLNFNPDLENATKDGDTPLLKAVRNRNSEIVNLLLEKKAKVSAADKKGDTALHIAMRARSKHIVEILLRNPKHSQLLYRPNRAGETPYNIDMSHPKTILGQIFGARRLNTNEDNENMLGYDLYSSALADFLSEPSLSMPITVGLYAKWGSGKSFLLTKLRDEMKNFAKEWVDPVFQFNTLLFLVIFHMAIVVATVVYIATEATTTDVKAEIWAAGVAAVFFLLCFLFLGFIWFASKSYDWDWPYNFNVRLTRKMNNLKLILQILFCHPPGASREDGISAQPIRFFFTDQTRLSSTTGGENSVVQMIGSLYDSIESHYGTLATRLYRAFRPKPVKSASTWTWRKMCCLPYVVIFEIIFFMVAIGFSALTYYIRRIKSINSSEDSSSANMAKATLEVILILAALLLAVATVANAYTWSKLFISLLFSQRRHLQRSISKLDTLKSEGFLQTLRQEVNLMKDMVKCLDGLNTQQTRLVIIVDGLDSCEQQKVLLILDTVHVLFSDANSQFIIILAIDPHVIAKAVELNDRRVLTESNIGGFSYLNNMVHLPFYLQNSGLRKVKVAQQTASSHKKATQANSNNWSENEENLNTFLARSSSSRRLSNENNLVSASRENLKYAGRKGSRKLKLSESVASSIGSNLNRIGGAQDLTKMLLTDDYFSDVNPRSMRRLMNVVYVTGRLLKAFQIDFNWYRLASWINITEQWPFRTSWIIYHYDLFEEQLEDNTPLKSIYDKIRPMIPSMKESEPLLELDRDEKKFEIFLSFHRSSLLISDLKIFLPFTINLDPYLKKVIKEETQNIEEDGLVMPLIRQSPYAPMIHPPPIKLWHGQTPVPDWSSVTSNKPYMTPTGHKERRHGVVNMPHNIPSTSMPYAQAAQQMIAPWSQFEHIDGVGSSFMGRALPTYPPAAMLESEPIKTKLSSLNVEGVCKLLSSMEDLNQNSVPDYVRLIWENNINGKVLLHCDLDDLKKLLHMSFGDWEMFKVKLIQLREYEIASIFRQDEEPATFSATRKPERKSSVKSSNNGFDKTDSSKLQPERERKQSVIEKQVTLEEQMICGALQTLNEEACEDVLEETADETKVTVEQELPQTSVIPPSPDFPQDIQQTLLNRGARTRKSSNSSVGETDFVLLQSSGHAHWHPVSICISGNTDTVSDISSKSSNSQEESPVQERRYSVDSKPTQEPKGRHVVIKTDNEAHTVSISSSSNSAVYENYSHKRPTKKDRPTHITLIQKETKQRFVPARHRSKSIDNSHKKDRYKEKVTNIETLQRLTGKLFQSNSDLNEHSDNESTPLVSEVSSPSIKSCSEAKTSISDNDPLSPLPLIVDKPARGDQNGSGTTYLSHFGDNYADKAGESCGRERSRTFSGNLESSLLNCSKEFDVEKHISGSCDSLQRLSPALSDTSAEHVMESQEKLPDVYCDPARSSN
ncbi:kinase D-interacting substrate of 220 kDa B isoform X3 [Anthonomus grandis grandis]|uniref:kinase D-interacting substrate of 220 kDa B isoform X3 n=1 Tax=Anthonomus grandis grandis TaxID=2921223 RepID=UPI0021658FC0|nr:kinase D-interacting substrate of 220 kDa B isoform X3 [Anthonomus grandis grandis]